MEERKTSFEFFRVETLVFEENILKLLQVLYRHQAHETETSVSRCKF